VTWTTSAELPLNETVATMGGQSITFDARQRPHLVIDTAQGVNGGSPSDNPVSLSLGLEGLHKRPGGGGEHAVDEAVQGLGPSRLRSLCLFIPSRRCGGTAVGTCLRVCDCCRSLAKLWLAHF
jgi:hypothetical protein